MNTSVQIQMTPEDLKELVINAIKEAQQPHIQQPAYEEFIDRQELMRLTKIQSATTVIAHERQGIFEPRRVGKKILYRKSQVIEAMKSFSRV